MFLVSMESKIVSTTQQTMVVQSLRILTIHYCKNIWVTSTIFLPTQLHGSLVPRPRPAFRRLQYQLSVLQATESWAGPGNEASCMAVVYVTHHKFKTI